MAKPAVKVTLSGSLAPSDEGLTLETSAFESLYGGQFILSTQSSLSNLKFFFLKMVLATHVHSFAIAKCTTKSKP